MSIELATNAVSLKKGRKDLHASEESSRELSLSQTAKLLEGTIVNLVDVEPLTRLLVNRRKSLMHSDSIKNALFF